MKRRKPRHDQPLLPLHDTVGAMPVVEAADEPDEPPGNPDDALTSTEWAERYLDGAMSLDDDELYTAEEIDWMRRYPTDYDRTPNPERTA